MLCPFFLKKNVHLFGVFFCQNCLLSGTGIAGSEPRWNGNIISAAGADNLVSVLAPATGKRCCGAEYERIREFWSDPNPKKRSYLDTDPNPDTVVKNFFFKNRR
jgi:hypothetical protein